MSKLLVVLLILAHCVSTNAQPASSDRFSTIEEVAGHRVLLYNVEQMKSMKHLPFYLMNEKGKLKQVKEVAELTEIIDGCRFDEEAAVEHVKKDTYLKLVKGSRTYYIIIDPKDNPYLPEGLRNYDYWTDMMAEFRETYAYKEMPFKDSSLNNAGEEAGKYASVTWMKINIPGSLDDDVTFSYEIEGNTMQIVPTDIDNNVFVTEQDVEVARRTLAEGMKALEEYKRKYEYVDVDKISGFSYSKNDVLVGHYLPITWGNVFLPKGSHDSVKYRITAGYTPKEFSDSELANSGFMSTDDVVRIEIGEEWVDVAYKENDESNNEKATESAKGIQVDGFDLDESDLTAMQQGTSVLDKDGNRCALIKVETKESDLTFDVGVQGIAKTKHKTGEEWLYVPSGIRTIQITHPQYGSYQYVIPRKVEKGRTYSMQLSFDKKAEVKRKGEITQGLKDAVKKYDVVHSFNNGFAYVSNYDGKYYLIDMNGNEITACCTPKNARFIGVFDPISKTGLIPVSKDNKYGYVNTTGKLVIPYIYEDASVFSEGLASVAKKINGEEKYGYIDESGNLTIPFQFDGAGEFVDGLAVVGNDNGYYAFIDKQGKLLTPYKFNIPWPGETVPIDMYKTIDGMTKVAWGEAGLDGTDVEAIIDENLNVIVSREQPIGTFLLNKGYICDDNSVYDKTGKTILKDVHPQSAVHEGLIKIYDESTQGFGFINLSGKTIIPCVYDYASIPKDGLIAVGKISEQRKKEHQSNIEDDEYYEYDAMMEDDVDWGFIDRLGREVVPCKYIDCGNFSEGYAAVCKIVNEKYRWTYIDKKGNLISDFKYSSIDDSEREAESFHEGLVVVCKGTDYGYMDKYGNDTFDE